MTAILDSCAALCGVVAREVEVDTVDMRIARESQILVPKFRETTPELVEFPGLTDRPLLPPTQREAPRVSLTHLTRVLPLVVHQNIEFPVLTDGTRPSFRD